MIQSVEASRLTPPLVSRQSHGDIDMSCGTTHPLDSLPIRSVVLRPPLVTNDALFPAEQSASGSSDHILTSQDTSSTVPLLPSHFAGRATALSFDHPFQNFFRATIDAKGIVLVGKERTSERRYRQHPLGGGVVGTKLGYWIFRG